LVPAGLKRLAPTNVILMPRTNPSKWSHRCGMAQSGTDQALQLALEFSGARAPVPGSAPWLQANQIPRLFGAL
jgi:hypothetical protein